MIRFSHLNAENPNQCDNSIRLMEYICTAQKYESSLRGIQALVQVHLAPPMSSTIYPEQSVQICPHLKKWIVSFSQRSKVSRTFLNQVRQLGGVSTVQVAAPAARCWPGSELQPHKGNQGRVQDLVEGDPQEGQPPKGSSVFTKKILIRMEKSVCVFYTKLGVG